jgi:hypothetical protein
MGKKNKSGSGADGGGGRGAPAPISAPVASRAEHDLPPALQGSDQDSAAILAAIAASKPHLP